LSSNGLSTLPKEITELKNLQSLDLSSNGLSTLPKEITELKNLQSLYWRNNKISTLPKEITELKNLQSLDLSSNGLSTLPKEITELKNLQSLDLRNIKISTLPKEITELKNLQSLDLSSNGLSTLPKEITELKNLQSFYLRDNKISTLPKEITELKNLQSLNLSYNGLNTLPKEITELKNLKSLYLSSNGLSTLPKEITKLKNLQSLDLSYNGLSTLPKEITELKNLQSLNLRYNGLSTLPKEITELKNLQSLNLSSNGLSTLPKEITELKNLQSLDLRNNKISTLPKEITELKLKIHSEDSVIMIFSNKIIFINNKGICIYSNPIENEIGSIIKGGRKSLVAYFDSIEDNLRYLNEVKVILIGEGGAGKTSLVKRIFGEKYDKKESQTHGVIIKDKDIVVDKRKIKIHFWDFGGQQIMHSAHQFFLSEKALYILVIDSRENDSKISDILTKKYLKQIKTFGGDSPILIVMNKIDENPSFELNRKDLSINNNIKEYFKVSCETDENIPELLEKIDSQIGSLKNLSTKWGENWFKVKEELENSQKNHITFTQFKNICKKNNIPDLLSQETLLDHLNQLGIISNFSQYNLKDTKILKPRWVTNAIYRIINSKQLDEYNGVLDKKMLSGILHSDKECKDLKKRDKLLCDIKYDNIEQSYIIALMKEFKVCFEQDDAKLLFPNLLNPNEPEFEFDEKNSLKVILKYDYLPSSVIPHFIIRMQDYIFDNKMWRTGLVIEDKENGWKAIIREDLAKENIYIYINGILKQDAVSTIIRVFKEINSKFERLDVRSLIEIENTGEFFLYNDLIKLLIMRETTVTIPKLGKKYDILKLLGSYTEKPKVLNLNDGTIIIEGGLTMGDRVNIKGNKGDVNYIKGNKNVITKNVGISNDLIRTFLLELNKSNIEEEVKEEIKEIVEGLKDESDKENPKKTIIKSLIGSLNDVVTVAKTTVALSAAAQQLTEFFSTMS
jgi:small GTP-binding protein